jgi:hypothetical protein
MWAAESFIWSPVIIRHLSSPVTERAGAEATLLSRIQDMLCSNLSQDWLRLLVVLISPSNQIDGSASIRPWSFPSIFFPVYRPSVNLPLEAIKSSYWHSRKIYTKILPVKRKFHSPDTSPQDKPRLSTLLYFSPNFSHSQTFKHFRVTFILTEVPYFLFHIWGE